MKFPRDVTGPQLVKSLRVLRNAPKGLAYPVTTQEGGENHEVVPHHDPIKAGTLSGILKRIANHHGMTVDELLKKLDL